MAKGKDFYGKEVTAVIEDACREFGLPQEELDIEILETGSAGIFGLCKKKAHIRVLKKQETVDSKKEKQEPKKEEKTAPISAKEKKTAPISAKEEKTAPISAKEKKTAPISAKEKKTAPISVKEEKKKDVQAPEEVEVPVADKKGDEKKSVQSDDKEIPPAKAVKPAPPGPVEPPTEEVLAQINEEICRLLELMGYPSQVVLAVEGATLNCHLSGEHEEVLIGSDGRTLDSLQYLLRKMISRRLPDRMMLALNAGDFRERRAEELKERARQLAEEVKENGKTQAIPALNPAERRVVHMILQEDKAIRSRSVGEGLFKKVLIYKPGKGNKSTPKKRRGRQGGRTSEK